jgi:hypothetical protein
MLDTEGDLGGAWPGAACAVLETEPVLTLLKLLTLLADRLSCRLVASAPARPSDGDD